MRTRWVVLAVAMLVAVLGLVAVAQDLTTKYWVTEDRNTAFTGDVSLGGKTYLGALAYNASSATVVSSTFAVSADYNLYVLDGASSQTGVHPTGGTLYQEITLLGSGSYTFRLDDGTSMTIGANRTIAAGDVTRLLCVDADGDEWVCAGGNDN